MARPRRRSRIAVSLFPFLSVLACIIGTLTLLITATAVGEVGVGALDLERYQALESELAAGRRELAALRDATREQASLDAALAEERDANKALADERARLAERIAAGASRQGEIERRERANAALDAELDAARREREALATRLAERRRELARAPIRVEPSGSGSGLEPHFVECRSDGVVLYEGAQRRPIRVPESRIGASLDVRGFLRRVVLRGGASVILLYRPDGIRACYAMEQQIAEQRARYGRVPLPAEGELDFRALPAPAEGG